MCIRDRIIPLVMADIIDVGVAAGDQHYIVMKGLQMIGMALIALILGQGYARFAAACGQGCLLYTSNPFLLPLWRPASGR